MSAGAAITNGGSPRWESAEANNGMFREWIGAFFSSDKQRYGSPRVMQQPRQAGRHCGENRVARLMRDHEPSAARRKRAFHPRTTQAGVSVAPDSIKDLKPGRSVQIWVSDLTCVAHAGGLVLLGDDP